MRVVAHRGRVGDDPENAVESLDGLPGWTDGAEVDIRPSRDGVLVAMHDDTVDRTTNGHGPVGHLTGDELCALELGDGVRVPRFREYLAAFAAAHVPWLFVDVKSDELVIVDAVAAQLLASDVADRAVVMVRTSEQLVRVRDADARLAVAALGLRRANIDRWLTFLEEFDVDVAFVAPHDEAYLEERVITPALLHAGLRFGGSIINRSEVLDRLVDDGGTTVITDRVADLAGWPDRRRAVDRLDDRRVDL